MTNDVKPFEGLSKIMLLCFVRVYFACQGKLCEILLLITGMSESNRFSCKMRSKRFGSSATPYLGATFGGKRQDTQRSNGGLEETRTDQV